MSGLRERKKRQTRKAIMNAAIKLFSKQGFTDTSMEKLARAAGVGKSTIYGYFRTKDEIFLAFCEEELNVAFAELDRKIDENASLADQLVAQMMGQITYVTRNRDFGRVFVRQMIFPDEDSRLQNSDLNRRYVRKLNDVLARAQKLGELPEEADLLFLMAHFHALYILGMSMLYTGDVTSLEHVEVLLRALVLQTLHGPAALKMFSDPASSDWDVIKQQFLQRHNLDI